MKLLTKQILNDFKKQGSTDKKDSKDIRIIAKFFNPAGAGTWYATEYNEQDETFFGFVSINNDFTDELGYFSLYELTTYRSAFGGLSIERDRFFGKHYLKEVLDGGRP